MFLETSKANDGICPREMSGTCAEVSSARAEVSSAHAEVCMQTGLPTFTHHMGIRGHLREPSRNLPHNHNDDPSNEADG